MSGSYTRFVIVPHIALNFRFSSSPLSLSNHRTTMASFHPTRREIILVLSMTVLLGLFLQFDSIRLTDSDSSDSLLRFRPSFGHRRQDDCGESFRGKEPEKWLEDVDTEGFPKAGKVAGMAETKVKWGEQGAPRTQVLAHAPGESLRASKTVENGIYRSSVGWTIFDNIYLFNGTWFIVTDNPSSIPLLRLMVSTGNEIWNDEESIRGR